VAEIIKAMRPVTASKPWQKSASEIAVPAPD
jgi:hypothetical protein